MKTKEIIRISLLIAITTALGFVVRIPTLTGFFTLVDLMIYLCALIFGKKYGLLVGGFSGFLIDLLAGYPQWSLISFGIHGLQGYIVGALGKDKNTLMRFLALAFASILMVAGYFLATWAMYGLGAGIADTPANIMQEIGGMVGAMILFPLVKGIVKES